MPNLYDSEDVDVQAKNVHIDLEPHRHEDTYEALSCDPAAQMEQFLDSPHSNIGEGSAGSWQALQQGVAEAEADDHGAKKDDEDDVDFMNRLNKRLGIPKTDPKKPHRYLDKGWEPPTGKDAGPDTGKGVYGSPDRKSPVAEPTDPTGAGGKARYKAQDPGGKLPIDFQDYDGPVHPHLQKARGDLKKGLDWVLNQVRQAVPNLDKFKPGNRPKPGSGAGAASGKSSGVSDIMPGPGGHMWATANKASDDEQKPQQRDPSKAGTGGYWELARLAQELEQIPTMASDKAMQRMQSVTTDLHKLKNSLKKNPAKDPELEKAAKGVEIALQGIPALMKSAGTLAKSSGSDKGLWQRKMTSRPGEEPDIPMDARPGMSKGDLDKAAGAAWRPKGQVIHPTGQDPKQALSKADKEKAAAAEKGKAVQQRVQPQVRKAAEQEPDKGPVKPTIPQAAKDRAQPKIRKAADKKDEPEKKDDKKEPEKDKGPEWTKAHNKPDDKKEPEKKEPEKKEDKKESAWRKLAALVG